MARTEREIGVQLRCGHLLAREDVTDIRPNVALRHAASLSLRTCDGYIVLPSVVVFSLRNQR